MAMGAEESISSHLSHTTVHGMNFSMGQPEIPLIPEDENVFNRVYETALIVDKYYTPLLCLFGTLGNSLSLIVFYMDAKYRSQSAPFYLSALAISDTGFLLNLFFFWLDGVYGAGLITSSITCPLVMYLSQVTCFLSVYFIVAFSIERYVAVHYPFSRPRLCTRSKAKKAIGALTLIALVSFSYVWWIAKVIEIDNGPEYHNDKMSGITSSENMTDFHSSIEKLFPSYEQVEEINVNGSFRTNTGQISKPSISSFHSESLDEPNLQLKTHVSYLDEETLLPWESKHSGKHSQSEKYDFEHDDPHHHQHFPTLLCTVPEKYYQISEIANYIDSVFTLVIPFLLITFFNMRIAICVWKLKHQREEIMVMGSSNKCGIASGKMNVTENYADEILELDDDTTTSSSNCSRGKRASCSNLQHNHHHLQNHHHRNNHRHCFDSRNSRRRTEIMYLTQSRNDCSNGNNGQKFQKRGVRFQTSSKEIEEEQQQGLLTPLPSSSTTPTVSPSMNKRLKLSIIRQKGHHHHSHFSSSSSEVRVTKTLLLISCMFLMLNLPAHFLRCAQFIQSLTGTSRGKDFLRAALPWTNILFNTNFAVNFLLYCASGRNFRKSLLNIIFKVFGKRRHQPSSPPQLHVSLLARKRRKSSAGYTTATIRLSPSVPNGNWAGELSSGGTTQIVNEVIRLETMASSDADAYTTYIGDNIMSAPV